jgi:hypothetical protein
VIRSYYYYFGRGCFYEFYNGDEDDGVGGVEEGISTSSDYWDGWGVGLELLNSIVI